MCYFKNEDLPLDPCERQAGHLDKLPKRGPLVDLHYGVCVWGGVCVGVCGCVGVCQKLYSSDTRDTGLKPVTDF